MSATTARRQRPPPASAAKTGVVEEPVGTDFDALFHTWAPYVLRVLPRMGVATRDLDDVAQDVFLAVHRGLPSFEGRSSLKTWLYGICIRTCANYRARAHRRHEQLVATTQEPVHQQTPAQALQHQRALAALDAALARLPHVQRSVFVLHEIEELSVLEIAEALDCSKYTVYARLYAAKRAVQTWLTKHAKEYTP